MVTSEVVALHYLTGLVAGVLVGTVSPSLVITKSVVFGVTLLHGVLAGALVGVYLEEFHSVATPPLLTAFAYALVVSLLVAEIVERGVPEDSAIGVSVAISTTLTVILTYYLSLHSPVGVSKALGLVFGTAAVSTVGDLSRLAAVSLVAVPLIHIIKPEIKYLSFDPEGFSAMGLSPRAYRYAYLSVAALTASTLTMTLGVLIAHIALVVPGLVSYTFTPRKMYGTSYVASLSLFMVGYLLSDFLGIPPSGGVGLVASVFIFLSLLRRWSRR